MLELYHWELLEYVTGESTGIVNSIGIESIPGSKGRAA